MKIYVMPSQLSLRLGLVRIHLCQTRQYAHHTASKPGRFIDAILTILVVLTKFGAGTFKIKHYPQLVEYSIPGLLEKNKDTLKPETIEAVQATDDDLIAVIVSQMSEHNFVQGKDIPFPVRLLGPLSPHFPLPPPKAQSHASSRVSLSKRGPELILFLGRSRIERVKGNSANKQTVTQKFKIDLSSLMQTLQTSGSHFILCFAPNSSQTPNLFDTDKIVHQMRLYVILLHPSLCL